MELDYNFNPSEEYILYMSGPSGNKGTTFNRAFGPFTTRSRAYAAKKHMLVTDRANMKELGESDGYIEAYEKQFKWALTRLWRDDNV